MTLSKHVRPKLDDARLARQWSAIEARQGVVRSRSWTPVFALAFALAAIALVWAWRRPVPAPSKLGVISAESKDGRTTMTLADGSRITTEANARLSFEEISSTATRVVLAAGSVDFDVHHDPARSFVVLAGEVTIVDTGTQFHVERAEDRVSVTVREGSVRIDRAAAPPSNLSAGESWASAPVPVDGSAVLPLPPAVVDAGKIETPPHDDTLARFDALAATDPSRAFEVIGGSNYPRTIERATAKQIFALGDVARLTDHPREAALAFDALRTKHRADPRAGLAAMELGRLRQDTLHDLDGAEEAYRDAIVLSPDAPFREDAEARRVDVLDTLRNDTACIAARDAYLSRYPSGVHAKAVEKRCSKR